MKKLRKILKKCKTKEQWETIAARACNSHVLPGTAKRPLPVCPIK